MNDFERAVIDAAKAWAYRMSDPALPMPDTESQALYVAVGRLRRHDEERPDAIVDTERLYDE